MNVCLHYCCFRIDALWYNIYFSGADLSLQEFGALQLSSSGNSMRSFWSLPLLTCLIVERILKDSSHSVFLQLFCRHLHEKRMYFFFHLTNTF